MQLKIRRALLSVSDKSGVVELGRALAASGAELVATGRTAQVLRNSGLAVRAIEEVSGSPEAFQGRMKTLSFAICSGILYRRGDASDEADLKKLGLLPIDCVVVNFYPFEQAVARRGVSRDELVEEIDIGGPTLVRAAAKNSPDVLVLTDPEQYPDVIADLKREGAIPRSFVESCAAQAWERVYQYDEAIAQRFGSRVRRSLRYGENPHQKGDLEIFDDSPIAWPTDGSKDAEDALTQNELSYNNILDLSSAYQLASDLTAIDPVSTGVVIVKHNNPCGVALVPRSVGHAQRTALVRAWEGDPVSAFGGVVVFTDPLEGETAAWLAERFVELVAAPGLVRGGPALQVLIARRKNLKAVAIRRWGETPTISSLRVPGGVLTQESDRSLSENLTSVTARPWPAEKNRLARFGIAVCRSLKSNAIALVREIPGMIGALQLVGAGQGQPNRVEALKVLAIPRALGVLGPDGGLGDCVMVSDAFFPFRDTVDVAAEAGVRWIVQPGGSVKDAESIAACDEAGVAMAFTGVRHFRH